MKGTIKRLIVDKGFGFIVDGQGVEHFFHRSGVLPRADQFETLREGQKVTFEQEKSPKGPRASQIQVSD